MHEILSFGDCLQCLPYIKIGCIYSFLYRQRRNELTEGQPKNCELTFVFLKDIEHVIFKQTMK